MFVRACFQALADPFAHSRILDMHEFRADGVGINSVEAGDHLAQRHRLVVEKKFRRNAQVDI